MEICRIKVVLEVVLAKQVLAALSSSFGIGLTIECDFEMET